MQRIRIGLMGLACVFLLVVLAAAMLGFSRDDPQGPPPVGAAAPGKAAVSPKAAPPSDPLAELGVAPGNPADVTNADAPPAAAPPAR